MASIVERGRNRGGHAVMRGKVRKRIDFIFLIPFLMDFSQQVVNQARKTRGYLQKKSSGLISVWQKRYFIILEERLAYYSDETLQEEKKSILIPEINTIKVVDDNEFHLVTKKRVYELRTDQEDTRDLWVASLNILLSKNQPPQVHSPKARQTMDKKPNLSSFTSKPQSLTQTSPLKLPETKKIESESQFSPQSFFQQIGLPTISSKWREESVQNKIILVKMPRSCFFIISCKTLLFSHEDQDFMGEQSILPYELNTLYLYQYGKTDNSGVVEICKCSEITTVEEEAKRIVIVVGERIFNLDFDPKFIDSSQKTSISKKIIHSIHIGKEYYNPLSIKLKRNIDKMLYLYDSKQMTLTEIVKKQIQKCLLEVKESNPKTEFRKTFENMRKSAREVINCCEVLGKSRVEFKERFVREYHIHVMNYIHKNWGALQKGFTLSQQKKIILILYDFWKSIKDIVKDSKMFQASILMHKKLMQKYQEQLLSKIDTCFSLKQQQILEQISLELNGDTSILQKMTTLFYSNSIYRQLHIDIRLVLYEFPQMPVDQKILHEYLILFRNVFKHIAEQTFKFIDKWKNINLIIGTCNQIEFIKNSLFEEMYSRLKKDYKTMASFIQNNCLKQIDSQISNTEILLVKNLFVHTFTTIDRGMLSKNLDEIDVNLICKEILIKLEKFIKMNKYVKRNIYEASFQEICYFYYTNIIKFNRNNNDKQYNSEFFIKKIAEDVKSIAWHFEKHLHQDKIYAHVKDLTLLKDFIQNDVSQLRKICQNIKKEFGNSFTEQAVVNLLGLRDMSTEARDNLVLEFNDLVKNSADSLEEISIMSSSRQSFLDNWNNARSRKSTLTLSINQFYQNQHTIHQNKYSCSVWKQGYLLKKKITKTSVSPESRAFFKINQSKIEQYESQSCQSVSNVFELHNVKRCALHHDKNYIFFLQFPDFKLQFKAETSDQAKEWVRNIYEEAGTLATLRDMPTEKEGYSDLCVQVHREFDPSTMDSCKLGKEKSPERSASSSPMLKKKKESSDKQREPSSPQRIVRVERSPKALKSKKKGEDEDNDFKCSKGCFF